MNPEFFLQLVVSIAAGAGVYAAIKSDLTKAIITAEMALTNAGTANRRIDDIINNKHGGNHG